MRVLEMDTRPFVSLNFVSEVAALGRTLRDLDEDFACNV
jgi:hypothetical protein